MFVKFALNSVSYRGGGWKCLQQVRNNGKLDVKIKKDFCVSELYIRFHSVQKVKIQRNTKLNIDHMVYK